MSDGNQRIHVVNCDEVGNRIQCDNCLKAYAGHRSFANHIARGRCSGLKDQAQRNELKKLVEEALSQRDAKHQKLADAVSQLSDKVEERSKSPRLAVHNHHHSHNNQQLNVMCLGSKDNLLDILASQGDLPLALTWIRDSALGKLASDCRILERVYLPPDKRPAILYRNKTKNQFVYYDENNERQIETNPAVLAKKLADILQRSYLKGMESLKTDLAGNVREDYKPLKSKSKTPMPEVQAYDLHIWNAHIHELNDEKYQKRLLKSMKLPIESDM